MECKRSIKITIGLMALFLGGMIYVIFRSRDLLMFTFFDATGISDFVSELRQSYSDTPIASWVNYNAPAALWLLSYMFIMDTVWREYRGKIIYWAFLSVIPLMALISEILQYFALFSGTFDLLDLLSYLIAVLASLLILNFSL